MNKQIDEMVNDLRALDNLQHNPNYTANYQRAVGLHSLGYRKQSDTAREIITTLEAMLEDNPISHWHKGYLTAISDIIQSIKRKYEVQEDEQGNKNDK